MGAIERTVVILRKAFFVFISLPFLKRQLLPDKMVLVGMLICCNYNVLDYGDARYWLFF